LLPVLIQRVELLLLPDHRSHLVSLERGRLIVLELIIGGVIMAEVRLQEGEGIESALRRFKRKVQTEDIIKEVKRHSFYLKPGAKRRVKQALARKRALKKIRKDRD
jgi:small subunit ribosomal protein S21